MTTFAEYVAQCFHESYERLASKYGYETRKASAVPWDQVPEENKKLMIAVAEDLEDKGVFVPPGTQ
jgi:hypothetical protein